VTIAWRFNAGKIRSRISSKGTTAVRSELNQWAFFKSGGVKVEEKLVDSFQSNARLTA
jgi:hypothetical protein